MLTILKSKQSPSEKEQAEAPKELSPEVETEFSSLSVEARREIIKSAHFRGELTYALLRKIWLIFLATLPLDFLFIPKEGHALPEQALSFSVDALVLVLLLVCLLGLDKNNGLRIAHRFRELQGKVSESRFWSYALVGFFVLFTLGDVLLKFGKIGLIPALGVIVVFAFGAKRFLSSIAAKQAEFIAMQRDRLAWTLRSNQQLFLIQLAPLVCARLISLAGVLKAQGLDAEASGSFVYTLLSALLLISLAPAAKDFTATCRRCALPVSRALLDFGSCPGCDETAFLPEKDDAQKKADSQNPSNMPARQTLNSILIKLKEQAGAKKKQGEI